MSLSRIYGVDELPNQMLAFPSALLAEPENRTIQGELLAGFLGLSPEAGTCRVKPEIGWSGREGRMLPLSHTPLR
jgi:hypothetical protein